MPNAPGTPTKKFRIHPTVWAAAAARAAKEDTSVSAVLVAALEEYGGVKTPEPPARPRKETSA